MMKQHSEGIQVVKTVIKWFRVWRKVTYKKLKLLLIDYYRSRVLVRSTERDMVGQTINKEIQFHLELINYFDHLKRINNKNTHKIKK